VALCQARISTKPLWGFSSSNPYHSQSRAEQYICSNGNASETKANESFDNGVFFDIEAKRTPSIVRKLFSKRSEHVR
jgi:hypothetical protein